ncbi:response regulator transcription factor [Methylococcus mesophilus]|uniref:response regulator transcription factor n=1 Tax=Methylococcus mesophilus TaxID=2993564 RepID=UPI00224B647E|nr:response regulator transcription factor [Methylococcus mesophilus]UZR27943.1 response regulator transcription factor [Methylococcus mesophilus]
MIEKAPPYTVSIVEDEPVLREELAFQLAHHGFAVETFENAAQFYRYLAVRPKTVAVLDIGLAGEDGLSVCQYLRSHDTGMGIVFVTARGLRDDRLSGLDAGADAYLVKPVDLDELVLILRRLGQRLTTAATAEPRPVRASMDGQWELDSGLGMLVTPNGTRIRLSLSEAQLLHALLAHQGEPCTHAELAAALGSMPEDYNKHRTEVIFSRLRERVYRHSGLALPIQAERCVGYRLLPFATGAHPQAAIGELTTPQSLG